MIILLITILYAVMLMPVSYVGGGSQLTVIITLDLLTGLMPTVRFSGALGPHFSSARARSLVFQQSTYIDTCEYYRGYKAGTSPKGIIMPVSLVVTFEPKVGETGNLVI